MVNLWVAKIKYNLGELSECPERYYSQVLAKLVAEGYYDTEGNRLK